MEAVALSHSHKILVVEDEEDIRDLLRVTLERAGYCVLLVASGELAIGAAVSERPDLVVLDLMLPGVDGLEVCSALKRNAVTRSIPIVMLTAKGEEGDVISGIERGADDYVTKPFSPNILLARIKGILRRLKQGPLDETAAVRIDGIFVNPSKREVFVDNNKIDLTNSEFKILHYLARHAGVVFTREQIVDAVHGTDYPVTDRSVDVQIVGLRKKLGKSGDSIETVRGVGYRMRETLE